MSVNLQFSYNGLVQNFRNILVTVAVACLMLSCQGGGEKKGSGAASSTDTTHHSLTAKETKTPEAKEQAPVSGDTNCIKPEMIFVKGGRFTMGNNKNEQPWEKPWEAPEHTVTLSSFYIGKYEVTVGEFRRFMNTHSYATNADKAGYSYVWDGKDLIGQKKGVNWEYDMLGKKHINQENHPVTHVSRIDAEAYCQWLSRQTGKKYRLATEAEWEYAAKGGPLHEHFTYSGSDDLNKVGWYSDNSGMSTHPVGQKLPNGLGVYDMSGNVWEWCSDQFGAYNAGKQTNPSGPGSPGDTASNGVLRGGAWRWFNVRCRNTARRDMKPGFNASGIGFRLVASE